MKQINNDMINVLKRYLYCGYECSSSKANGEVSSIMYLKEDSSDHESVVFSIKDVFEMHLEDLIEEYPNIIEMTNIGCSLDIWYYGSEFVCRMGREVTEGPYCENAKKEAVDGLIVKNDSLLMALQELDTTIIKTKDSKNKELPRNLKKVIPVHGNLGADNK